MLTRSPATPSLFGSRCADQHQPCVGALAGVAHGRLVAPEGGQHAFRWVGHYHRQHWSHATAAKTQLGAVIHATEFGGPRGWFRRRLVCQQPLRPVPGAIRRYDMM